jgi:hypothetical protein
MSNEFQHPRLTNWEPGMPLPPRKETHGRKKSGRWWNRFGKKKRKPALLEAAVEKKPGQTGAWGKGEFWRQEPPVSPSLTVTVQDQLTEEEKQALLEIATSAHEISVSVALDLKTEGAEGIRRSRRTERPRVEARACSPSVRLLKRGLFALLAVLFALAFLFWAKFAYVYNIPSAFADSKAAAHAKGYLVYKTWWFGPPLFDLASYGNPANAEEMQAFYDRLGAYRIIVDSPSRVLWRYYGSR